MKKLFDNHRHGIVHFKSGDIIVMLRFPVHTGLSAKLQVSYRSPLVVDQMLAGDVYRVVQLISRDNRQLSTNAHVTQLKLWKPSSEHEENPTTILVQEEKLIPEKEGRSTRTNNKPVWLGDYNCSL